MVIPGWFLDGDSQELRPGSKTRDDWVIDSVDGHFWEWLESYPAPQGKFPCPSGRMWRRIREALLASTGLAGWPHNALRHSFATYDLSAYRDQTRTSLMLRHRSLSALYADCSPYMY